jgi:DNA-binding transcriptional ArsR family regulator
VSGFFVCFILRNQLIAFIHKTMRRDVFQAIAYPTRRAILMLIALHAMTPNAIAEHFDSSRQAVSKHIKQLHQIKHEQLTFHFKKHVESLKR